MAVERTKTFVFNLEAVIQKRFTNLQNSFYKIRLEEENEFQRAILDNNLSLEAQIAFRKEQLSREEGRIYPDQDYISTLKTSVSDLSKRNRYKKWQDLFKESFNAYELGRKSLDEHLTFLQNTLLTSSDIDIKEEIETQIQSANKAIQDRYWELQTADITLKQKDGTITALQNAIKLAEEGITKSTLLKDELKQKTLQTTKMVLERELKAAQLIQEEREVDLKRYGGDGIDAKMDWLKSKYTSASTLSENLVIDGQTFGSEREYWQNKLNGFIDTFIESKENEFKNDIYSNQNKLGEVKDETISNIKKVTESYLADPVLSQFANKFKVFQENIYSEAINTKLQNLNDQLEMNNTKSGIQNMKTQIDALQKQFPEIIMSPYYHDLEVAFAKKQEAELEKYIDKKQEELSIASDYLSEADLPEETKNKWINDITNQFKTHEEIKNFDIPYSDLTMDKPLSDYINELKVKYPVITQELTLEKLQAEQKMLEEKMVIEETIPEGYEQISSPADISKYEPGSEGWKYVGDKMYGIPKEIEETKEITPTKIPEGYVQIPNPNEISKYEPGPSGWQYPEGKGGPMYGIPKKVEEVKPTKKETEKIEAKPVEIPKGYVHIPSPDKISEYTGPWIYPEGKGGPMYGIPKKIEEVKPTIPTSTEKIYESYMAETKEGSRVFQPTKEKAEEEAKKQNLEIIGWKGFSGGQWEEVKF